MQAANKTELPPPPGVTGALIAGLDAISARLWVILFPLVLDLFLWLGPRLSIRNLMVRTFDQALLFGSTNGFSTEEIAQAQIQMADFFTHFNLLSTLRTFPVGVSSLISGRGPLLSPLGAQNVVEVSSDISFLGWFFLLTLLGWILGGLYFGWVAEAAGSRADSFASGRAVAQTLLFSVLLTVISLLLGVPFLLVLGVLQLLSPALMQTVMFVIAFLAVWIFVPIFFAPHGIFVRGQNALASILASLQMSRFTMPISSMFVLAALILSQGLNYLWNVPPEDSWMTLVGIAGHAFITTAVLAASFIYYRDMNSWLQTASDRLKPGATAPQM